jgi:hypothetical protein
MSEAPAPRDPLPGLTDKRLVELPLGLGGGLVLLVLNEDAERLAPVLDGEPRRMIPAGLESLDVEAAQVAEELSEGPRHVLLMVERSEQAVNFHNELLDPLSLFGIELHPTLLPSTLTVEQMISELPVGRDAVALGMGSRDLHLERGILMLWAASAGDEELEALVRGMLAGSSATPT